MDDQRTERDRRELRQIVDEFRTSLASLKKDARAALLASKRAIDSEQLSNRDELLRSTAVMEKQDLNEKVTEDALMKANNDVTEALQRTITLMQGELERSVLSSQLLDSSTASLRSTSSTYDVLDGLLSTSKHLITALEKSDWMDRLLILAGLIFFLLVVAFILKQRLVDRSLRLAFWWTRFLPDFSSDEILLQAEEGKGSVSSVVAVISSVATTASVAAASVSAAAFSPSTASEDRSPSATSLEPTETSFIDHLASSSSLDAPSPSETIIEGVTEFPAISRTIDTHDEL